MQKQGASRKRTIFWYARGIGSGTEGQKPFPDAVMSRAQLEWPITHIQELQDRIYRDFRETGNSESDEVDTEPGVASDAAPWIHHDPPVDAAVHCAALGCSVSGDEVKRLTKDSGKPVISFCEKHFPPFEQKYWSYVCLGAEQKLHQDVQYRIRYFFRYFDPNIPYDPETSARKELALIQKGANYWKQLLLGTRSDLFHNGWSHDMMRDYEQRFFQLSRAFASELSNILRKLRPDPQSLFDLLEARHEITMNTTMGYKQKRKMLDDINIVINDKLNRDAPKRSRRKDKKRGPRLSREQRRLGKSTEKKEVGPVISSVNGDAHRHKFGHALKIAATCGELLQFLDDTQITVHAKDIASGRKFVDMTEMLISNKKGCGRTERVSRDKLVVKPPGNKTADENVLVVKPIPENRKSGVCVIPLLDESGNEYNLDLDVQHGYKKLRQSEVKSRVTIEHQ